MAQKRILNREAIGKEGEKIMISGWVDTIRSHGKIAFIDLRDRTGAVQVVFTPGFEGAYEVANKLHPEWVIEVVGIVNKRPEKMINPEIKTGGIEILAEEVVVLSEAKTLPFGIDTDGTEINEELRMKYRYLDLRRERLSRNIKKRYEVLQFFRNHLQREDFIEVETPILTKSTPEGARDFLVPSRFLAGEFYALPQSPQQYKQLLMVAGLERYFQIARCFRDENSRANRQAEFTQLDIETSFMSQEEIMESVERLVVETIKAIFPEKIIAKNPFPIMTYKESMEKYKSDKPDIRKDKDELAFLWVINFPMFEWSENDKRWSAMHHPFTRPIGDDIEKLKKDPGAIQAIQYDLVLNGEEIAGGSLRSYKKDVLEAVFEIMGHKKDDIREKFGHLLDAFDYGVPPHGGIAFGFDRFISILLGEKNIREVIAFPKSGESRDLMMNAPSKIDNIQLNELNLKVIKNEKKTEEK